jgi:hypothetical protein
MPVASSVSAVLLWLLMALPARAEMGLPLYPGTTATRIGNDLVVGGEYHRLAYFTTHDSLMQVARFYALEWKKQGIPSVADGDFVNEGSVSAFYTRKGLQRSVILRRHGSKTLVFLTLKDLWVRPSDGPRAGLAALEGTLMAQDLTARSDPASARHRTSMLNVPVDGARERIRKALENRGFKLVHEFASRGGVRRRFVLGHARGMEHVTTVVSPVDDTASAVFQTSTLEGSKP